VNNSIDFSIIIPFKAWSPYLDECIRHIRALSLKEHEVILLPDDDLTLSGEYIDLPVTVLSTGEVNPAIKRDIGAKIAKGQFLAFIDDDAYPQADWLDVAKKSFEQAGDVAAIGGPAVTPRSDPFWARVSGAVFLSPTSGGNPERYVPCPPRKMVDDWPSVNLIVRADVFSVIGGFNSKYWPGEDTLFCLKILKETGKRIAYVPELLVWHHRRSGLLKHLRQIGNYGLHRGFFAKNFPETSRRFVYFIPTIWALFVFLGLVLSVTLSWAGALYLLGWGIYGATLIISLKDILRYESLCVSLGAIPYIMLTHIWYGAQFIQGFARKELHSSLGR
jgi:glycosyltransferase involved in cell wall biosynthesis